MRKFFIAIGLLIELAIFIPLMQVFSDLLNASGNSTVSAGIVYTTTQNATNVPSNIKNFLTVLMPSIPLIAGIIGIGLIILIIGEKSNAGKVD